jgi:hypothetical protein
VAAGAFSGGPVAREKRKKGRGVPGFGATCRGKRGRESGGPGTAQDSSTTGIGPRSVGVGGGAVTRQGRAARRGDPARAQLTDRAGRSRGPVVGAECGRERGSAAPDADRRARQHSAAWFGFKPIQTGSNGFKFTQTLTDPKGAFSYSKNWK